METGASQLTHELKLDVPLDWQRMLEATAVLQEGAESQNKFKGKEKGEVIITTQKPILLVTMSDLHIGNQATSHLELMKHLKVIKDTAGVFVSFNGDLADNLFVFRKGGAEEGMTAEMQGIIVYQMLKELDESGKVISVASGNHDFFQDNFYQLFARGLKAPLYRNWGGTNLKVGETIYEMFQFHEFTLGNSSISPTQRERRAMEYKAPTADIIVGSHTHVKAVEQGLKAGKMRVFIESGSYKVEDAFQVGHGNARHGSFDLGGACVLLFPDQKRMLPFYNLEDGIEALRRFNIAGVLKPEVLKAVKNLKGKNNGKPSRNN